jgi:ferritin-like metal-binding protein YciE
MTAETRFEDLFQEQLENLYDSEKRIAEALPKMIAQASSPELAEALQEHLNQTKEQMTRLEVIFERAGEQPGARTSDGIRGILDEAEKSTPAYQKSAALDLALVTAARKVEHYEIASYSAACLLAETLGQQDAFDLLQTTLQEETDAEEDLAEIAEGILTGDVEEHA